MVQKLILPINNIKLTASMKTAAYQKRFGYIHYGVDMVSAVGDRTLYASGDGLVVATGTDNVVGKVIAIVYQNVKNCATGAEEDVVFRYFHLESISVKAGDKVTKDTRLGIYGNTGSMQMAYHLHLEADTDTKNPLYSPTVNSSSFLKGRIHGANDKTMRSAVDYLHCKTSGPDSQTFTTANDAYIQTSDKTIDKIV
jgi:murein DD-endopeptidase MepM/ murein hydrolase activator NlpD